MTAISGQIAAPRTITSQFIDLVGPKGYIHNWVFVGIPAVSDRVFHPHQGHGTVAAHDGAHVHVQWDNGAAHKIPVGSSAGKPAQVPLAGADALASVKKPVGLSGAEKSALSIYGQSHGYRAVNPYLHHDGQVFDTGIMGYRPPTPAEQDLAKKTIAGLDSAFAKAAPISKPIVVSRRTGDVNALFGAPGSKVGKTFHSKSYTSTTTAEHGAPGNGYAYESKPGLLTVTVPAGSKVLPGNAHEQEVILPRNASFKVVSDQPAPDGQRHIHLEYQP